MELVNTEVTTSQILLTTNHEVSGLISGPSNLEIFLNELGLEWGPPSLIRISGKLFDWEVASLSKKVDISILEEA